MKLDDFIGALVAGFLPTPHFVHIVVICYKWVGAHIVVGTVAYIRYKIKK